MAILAEKFGLDWSRISQLLTKDDRVGLSHVRVPGNDNIPGFDGLCFPKDTSAWLQFANGQGVKLSLLEQAVKLNKELRS
jgi:UDP-glucose 6-dehydrogenase